MVIKTVIKTENKRVSLIKRELMGWLRKWRFVKK
jgi:hypothetical protein